MASRAYQLFEQAMANRKQVLCTYDGCFRELCPVILGHTNGQEMALAYQFAGRSKSSLPPQGQWKCLSLAKASNIQLRDGPWHAGASHTTQQRCVQEVDLDVNPASPYNPKRQLRAKGRRPASSSTGSSLIQQSRIDAPDARHRPDAKSICT